MNDTRYISKVVKNILSKLVRESINDEGITSKNVIATNGTITSILKQDWGLNDVWNDLMLPRFERMNEITKTNNYTYFNNKYQKFLPTVPEDARKGFQLKRIDHRHHAMDAIVIACTTRNHINYLNNQTALDKTKKQQEKQKDREDLKRLLCVKTKADEKGNYKWEFIKPWDTFTQDARFKIETTIVSIKQNLRIINKSVNYYQKYVNGKKKLVVQEKGDSWAIRKPLHKDTVYGKVNIKENNDKLISITNALDNWQLIRDPHIRKIVKTKLKELGGDVLKLKKYLNAPCLVQVIQ